MRMLDGRIDIQGTIEDLRGRGVLDGITHVEDIEANMEEQVVEAAKGEEISNAEIDDGTNGTTLGIVKDKKKPRKLVEEEHREIGSVKWRIYKTYLQAS